MASKNNSLGPDHSFQKWNQMVWKYKALNLASVSIVRWGICTYTHVFLDMFVCSGLQYKLYILTVCCSPKKFEKKSSLELIFWMSVNFPAWLPFYFEQGLDFLILFLSCNRISQPRHYWHMGLDHFLVCVCVCGDGGVLCVVGCLAATLAFPRKMPGAPSPQLRQPNMSLEAAKSPVGGKITLSWELYPMVPKIIAHCNRRSGNTDPYRFLISIRFTTRSL